MVEIKLIETEESERPFHKPEYLSTEQRDLTNLKKRIGTARDFVIFVGCKFPDLVHVDNRSEFIKAIHEHGCLLPERSIDRAIRLLEPFFSFNKINTGKQKADTMEADHRIVYGEMKE